MSDFWGRLADVRARNDVLEHPFYVRWTRGELTRSDLATYAGEYRHAVGAIADVAAMAASEGDGDLRRHAEEERAHVELWDRFGAAVGAGAPGAPAPETAECVATWTAGEDLLDHLMTLYAIEAAQPAISEVKRDGLLRHYGVAPGPGTAYFEVHAALDREHAAQTRKLIEDRLEGADPDRLLARAGGVLAANWRLLDGVERAAG